LKRREFIALIGDVAVSISIPALAQQGNLSTIGVWVLGIPPPKAFLKGLRQALGDLGYTEGQNIKLEIVPPTERRIFLQKSSGAKLGDGENTRRGSFMQ
jgi:hypothetical protein